MSMFYYIGANKQLPLGERGSKEINNGHRLDKKKTVIHIKNASIPEGSIPLEQIIDLSAIKSSEIAEYETMEDAAGIFIEDVHPCYNDIKQHFKSKYVFQFSANFGGFLLNERLKHFDCEGYNANKKCINELFKFIAENLNEHEEIEIYSCWTGEEQEPRNRKLDMIININSFELGADFELKDKQYIVVKRTN